MSAEFEQGIRDMGFGIEKWGYRSPYDQMISASDRLVVSLAHLTPACSAGPAVRRYMSVAAMYPIYASAWAAHRNMCLAPAAASPSGHKSKGAAPTQDLANRDLNMHNAGITRCVAEMHQLGWRPIVLCMSEASTG